MKVSRDLDQTREYTLGSGTYVAKPGEELVYDPKTGYQMRNVVGGGRGAGRGGPTAKEMEAYHARKAKDKPPAGIRAELDAMKQEKANEAGMKAHEGRKLAQGGPVRGAGIARQGVRKCKVV
jgi:hypothetical protein